MTSWVGFQQDNEHKKHVQDELPENILRRRITEHQTRIDGRINLDRWLVKVTKVGSSLTRLLPQHHGLRIDETKCINDNFTLHTLDWIHHHCYRTLIQSFKTLDL
jgi:hypothetical protein